MSRREFRAFVLSASRTDQALPTLPTMVANAVLPARCAEMAQTTLGNAVRLIGLDESLMSLGHNWYMLVQTERVLFTFAPQSGVSQAQATELTAMAKVPSLTLPWSKAAAMLESAQRRIPEALWNHLY